MQFKTNCSLRHEKECLEAAPKEKLQGESYFGQSKSQ